MNEEERHSFLTIPQIKAREIIRAHVFHRHTQNVDDESTFEDFDSVIKPLLMSQVDALSEVEADDASVQNYYKYLASSVDWNFRSQLDRDGWRWEIHSNAVSPSSTHLKTIRHKVHHETVRWACSFSESPSPQDCFSRFFFQNFLEQAVISSTNRSARSRVKATFEVEAWQDLDMNEFMTWIGILESMQIAETPTSCVEDYWQPNSFSFGAISIQFNFSKYMSQQRWLQILQCLNFDGDVSELFDAFNQNIEKTIIPGRALAICGISQLELSQSCSIKEWMCVSDLSAKMILRLPSSPSKVRHWSEQFRDPHTIQLLGLTQPYHFSFREAYIATSQCEADAIVQLHKRGIDSNLLSFNSPAGLPSFYPVDASRVLFRASNSCLVCDRSFCGKNVRVIMQQRGSCAICTDDSDSTGSTNPASILNDGSKMMKAMSHFTVLVDEHIKSFIKPIRQAVVDQSEIENFDKMVHLIWVLSIVEYNAKQAFDVLSSKKEVPLSQFRAQLANELLSGRSLPPKLESASVLNNAESKKRRIAEVHRVVRLDNSSAQVQRQCSLAHRCANKKSDNEPAPRTSNACSCSPSVPLCSKVCHTHHVLSQLDRFCEFNADGSV